MNAVERANHILSTADTYERDYGKPYPLQVQRDLARALLKAVEALSKTSHLCFMREDDNTQTIDGIEVITNKTLASIKGESND